MSNKREYLHKWYLKNKNRLRTLHKEYWLKNKEKLMEQKKKYNSKPETKELRRKYWEKRKLNPEYKKRFNEYHRIWQGNRRAKERQDILELLGGKCVKCGISDWRVLQIDHINGDGGKERRITNLNRMLLKNIDRKRHQILCANCNWIKMHDNKEYDFRY